MTEARCWQLWARIIHTVQTGDWEYSRVIACQLDRGHAHEHQHSSVFGEISWWHRKRAG